MEQIRLNKYLADHGICSRREADRLIEQCRVTVNGRIAGMGTKVSDEDEVALNGKRIGGKPKTVVLAFYKPVGVTCTEKDRHAEKIITDMIHYPIRVTYAGRLDKDSEGLLLLTNDGKLIDAMMRGANRHEKEYVVKVDKEITEEFLETMSAGIYLKELERTTRPCQVKAEGKFTFRIILTQGLNRQIRRMCEACGYEVKKLKRVRIMNISLDRIPYGKYRELTESEMEQLYTLAGLKPQETLEI
ncbi:MAG: pseudouridine synthase [Lachnospiraceae bacterium]|nr:pseudouridine synthase [Lachnospiraceae bacterium]